MKGVLAILALSMAVSISSLAQTRQHQVSFGLTTGASHTLKATFAESFTGGHQVITYTFDGQQCSVPVSNAPKQIEDHLSKFFERVELSIEQISEDPGLRNVGEIDVEGSLGFVSIRVDGRSDGPLWWIYQQDSSRCLSKFFVGVSDTIRTLAAQARMRQTRVELRSQPAW